MKGLLDKKLILVVGKGGVGRSTVAATIASYLAEQGRRTLLFQFNALDRFGSFFGKSPLGSDIEELAPNLFGVNTNPKAAMEEYGLMVLKFKRVYKMVFENRLTRTFFKAIPGLDDYSVLGKAWFHTTEMNDSKPKWDSVVFDMAASGHCVTMLNIPKSITTTVPNGPLTKDAGKIIELLQNDQQTSVVLTSLAEEMPYNESIELAEKLKSQCNIKVSHVVLNQIFPDHFPEPSSKKALTELLSKNSERANQSPALTHAMFSRDRYNLNQSFVQKFQEAFAKTPIYKFPFVFESPISLKHLSTFKNSFTIQKP